MKRAGSVWKRSPKTPISRSRYTDNVSASCMCLTRSRGPKRPRRWPRWRDNVRGGLTARCNVCGNIATWCSTGTIARSAGSVYPASGFFRSFSWPLRRWWIYSCWPLCHSARGTRCCRSSSHSLRWTCCLPRSPAFWNANQSCAPGAFLPMRLIYRPMLSYCVWKAILRAIKGAWVSWGKLERTASVPVRA